MKRILFQITVVAILLFFVAIGCKKNVNVIDVTLDKENITLTVDAMETLTASIHPNDATDRSLSWTCNNPAVAMIEYSIGGATTTIAVIAKAAGAATITVTTNDGKFTATCAVTVIPITEWVEIKGVKWATCNVNMPGTFAAKPEDAGMFYQWNRRIGWSSTDSMINSDGGTTWNSSEDTGISWEKANDPCPTGWRVPTILELQSLIAVGTQWTTVNGVNGTIFGSDDKIVFFPAVGWRSSVDGKLGSVGYGSIFWSGTPDSRLNDFAHYLYLGSDRVGTVSNLTSYGCSVRCVSDQK